MPRSEKDAACRTDHIVLLHQNDLVARDWALRQGGHQAGQKLPNKKRNRYQQPLTIDLPEHQLHQRLVGVDPGSAELVDLAPRRRRCQNLCDRFGDVAHIDRLQPGFAAAEQRQDRHHPRHGRQPVEERVVRPEQDARAEDRGFRKPFPHQSFADGSGPDIGRGRSGIGTDARNVHEPFDPCQCRRPGDMHGAVPMDRLEGRLAALDIVPDGVDHRVGALQRRANRRLVPYIGVDRGHLPVLAGRQAG